MDFCTKKNVFILKNGKAGAFLCNFHYSRSRLGPRIAGVSFLGTLAKDFVFIAVLILIQQWNLRIYL